MEKKEKKSLIFNIFLVIILIALIVVGVAKWLQMKQNNVKAEEEVVLKEVGYNSTVEHYGYKDAKGITNAFISSFEELSGEKLASMMNLGGTYIYSYIQDELTKEGVSKEDLKQETINRFDDKYVEVMKSPKDFSDFILMQYVMAEREEQIINGMPATVPNFTVIGEPKIEDMTKYLSKIDLTIEVTSALEEINEIDSVELLLLHREDTYYLMSYDLISSIPKTTNEDVQ